ncbi:MAG TPA: hypothetical protein DCE78_05120 [Bacteroidetes bacterium]|nr:hypothetical protein [Bacteroidota bacterium]
MKLIRKTVRFTGLVLIPVTILGAVFIYFYIRTISFSEADEYLTFEMQRIQRYYQINNDLPSDLYKINRIYSDSVYHSPIFSDTTVVDPINDEEIQFRELIFSVTSTSESDSIITIALRQALLGRSDVARGSIYIIFAVLAMFTISVLVVMNAVAGKIWQPFFSTLDALKNYKVQDSVPDFHQSDIDEFNLLNRTISKMLDQMSGDYQRTKEFNENAAHELQTQLALIRSAHEELLNTLPSGSEWIQEAGKAHAAASKLTHIQKSLLLLSKIANKEFDKSNKVVLSEIITSVLKDFDEVIELRKIHVVVNLDSSNVVMDEGLAIVLITNLIKNSVKHNKLDGMIHIELKNRKLSLINSGELYSGDPNELLHRFSSGGSDSMGLGLAIVKQICDLYGFDLKYTIDQESHEIGIDFSKSTSFT